MQMHALIVALFMIAYALILNGANYEPTKALKRWAKMIDLEEQESPEETQKTLRDIWDYISQGADPSPILGDKPILLFYAIKLGDMFLLRAAASSPNSERFIAGAQDTNLGTCLRYAARLDKQEVALELVNLGFPLHLALKEALCAQHLVLVAALIWRGADPNYENQELRLGAPLFLIHPAHGVYQWQPFKEEQMIITKELVRLGACTRVVPMNCEILTEFYAVVDQKARLIECASLGHIAEIESRLRPIIFEGENVLHAAIRLQSPEILMALLNELRAQGKIEKLINLQSDLNLSPLRLARNARQKNFEKLLISYGADPWDMWRPDPRQWQERGFWQIDLSILPNELWRQIFSLLSIIELNQEWWAASLK